MTSAHRFADEMFTCVGDLASLDTEVKQALCGTLESEGCWENLAHSLGLGILNTAFRLSPSPAKTLLDSYEVTHTDNTRSHTPASECSQKPGKRPLEDFVDKLLPVSPAGFRWNDQGAAGCSEVSRRVQSAERPGGGAARERGSAGHQRNKW